MQVCCFSYNIIFRIFYPYLCTAMLTPNVGFRGDLVIYGYIVNRVVAQEFIGLDKNGFFFVRKIVNFFFPISVIICFGCSKEPSCWDGPNVCPKHMFWLRIKKIMFWSANACGIVTRKYQLQKQWEQQ